MSDKHLSTQFDAELSGISNRVLEMGGLVESQVSQPLERAPSQSAQPGSQLARHAPPSHDAAWWSLAGHAPPPAPQCPGRGEAQKHARHCCYCCCNR